MAGLSDSGGEEVGASFPWCSDYVRVGGPDSAGASAAAHAAYARSAYAGYVTAKELPDGENPPANVDGNFIIGPTHNPAPEMTVQEGVPQGTIFNVHDGIDG